MTSPSPAPAAVVVQPEPESRLDQLAAAYAQLKPQADEMASRLKALTDGIKSELATRNPGATDMTLTSPHLLRPLRLEAVTRTTFDSTRLKAEHPEVWEMFAKTSTSWRLAAV